MLIQAKINLQKEDSFLFKELALKLISRKLNQLIFSSVNIKSDSLQNYVLKLTDKYCKNVLNVYLDNANKTIGEDFFEIEKLQKSNVQICIEDFDKFENSITPQYEEIFNSINDDIFNLLTVFNNKNKGHIHININSDIKFKLDLFKKAICYFISLN